MKSKIWLLLSVVGTVLLCLGCYNLGYHHGLEFMRASDSGLGGYAEWMGSWILIATGIILVTIGIIVNLKASNRQ